MGLVTRLFGRKGAERDPGVLARSWDAFVNAFGFGGNVYTFMPQQTLTGHTDEIGRDFAGLVAGAYQSDGIVFACELTRLSLFAQARFQYQRMSNGRPGDLWGNADLAILETPWPGGTTGDLLTRMLQDADFGGNAFTVRTGKQLVRLRPDWVTIVYGSKREDPKVWDPDAEIIGYVYQPGGPAAGREPIVYFPEQVAHFAPTPDPLRRDTGMSWLHPILTEVMGDQSATRHKLKFFDNGATVNLAIALDPEVTFEVFEKFEAKFNESHEGLENAYKTLFLGGGAKPVPVGANMQQIDFKAVQGLGETRIAAAAGVHPVIVGLSEGLQGSSLNAGNFAAARRIVADRTLWHLWGNAAGSLARIMNVPSDSRLWIDHRDIPFLREDATDQAKIQSIQAQSIKALVDAGFDAGSVITAITAGDLTKLSHTGLFSVQLQPPNPDGTSSIEANAGRALVALAELYANGDRHALPAVTQD